MGGDTPNSIQKYSGGSDCCFFLAYPHILIMKNLVKVLLSCLPSYIEHEKSGKSTFSFYQEFIKTLAILKANKDFCGKLCTHWFYSMKHIYCNHLFDSGATFI